MSRADDDMVLLVCKNGKTGKRVPVVGENKTESSIYNSQLTG